MRFAWQPTGLGSNVLALLQLLMAMYPTGDYAKPVAPPGVLQTDERNFWHSCSATEGFKCYFQPIESCAQATVKRLRDCTANEILAAQGGTATRRSNALQNLDLARAVLRNLWKPNEQTRAFLGAHINHSNDAEHITVHLRRGDSKADGRRMLTVHDVASHIKRLVQGQLKLKLGSFHFHLMSDSAEAADELFRLLQLPGSARLVTPPLPAELAA